MAANDKTKAKLLDNITLEDTESGLKISVKYNWKYPMRAFFLIVGYPLVFAFSLASQVMQGLSLLSGLALYIAVMFPYVIAMAEYQPKLRVIEVGERAISSLNRQEPLILAIAPYEQVYIQPVSRLRDISFRVIMTDSYGNKATLFQNLSHEQAVYILRVIDQHLKLNSPDFEADVMELDVREQRLFR